MRKPVKKQTIQAQNISSYVQTVELYKFCKNSCVRIF